MQIFHRRALTFGLQRFNGVCRGVISDVAKRILLLLVTGVVLALQAQDQPFVHTAEGRYLMPREWGRDPFYTFMPRERNEGYGNVHAATAVLSKKFSSVKGLAVDVSYGRFYLPDVKDFNLNKYGFPAYQQANVDVRYTFGGFFQGLDLQFLAVFKDAIKTTYDLPKYEINKVNLSHFNLILNYHF
jgi:hypothetical protein